MGMNKDWLCVDAQQQATRRAWMKTKAVTALSLSASWHLLFIRGVEAALTSVKICA